MNFRRLGRSVVMMKREMSGKFLPSF